MSERPETLLPQSKTTRLAIDVHDLTKRYGDATVLDNVKVQVCPGELVAITGPSGAGKSTLLHLLSALDSPDSGTVIVDGIDLAHKRFDNLSKFRREHVGIVFQLHNLIPRLTAAQNIEMAMFGTHRTKTERSKRALEVLGAVSLAGYANRKPPTMSGGERARVALARGMANEPPVLLADEPTGNLDDISAGTVIGQLRSLVTNQGAAVLVVSHDPRLNSEASRVLMLEGGHIVER